MRRLTTPLPLLLLTCSVALAQPANLRHTATVDVFERNRDAVVNVNTSTTVRQRFGSFDSDPLFQRFFGQPFERDVTRQSLGSGFIIHSDGYVVTNAHVVQGADTVQVNLADGTTLDAQVLASDTDHDLAILKVEPPPGRTLQAVMLGDSDDLMQGEPAIAIGNPLGYHHSVSAGVVSATGRQMQFSRDHALDGLIQTDTSINPGNSGGPLLNAYGQVIGINTAIRGDAQNIGFAIPVNQMRDLLADLLSPLAVSRVELGGVLQEKRTLEPPATVRVTLLWIDADGKSIEVRAINGKPVSDIVQAAVALLSVHAGDHVELDGVDGKTTLTAESPRVSDAQLLARQVVGLTPRAITPADRARLHLDDANGLLIESVEPRGPAAAAGLEPDDVLVQVGRHPIGSIEDLAALLSQATDGVPADVLVIRDGRLGRARLVLRGSV